MGLLDFIKTLPTLNELNGSFGEHLTKVFAKTFTDALVLHDILIDGDENGTSQIDLIMIGVKGIYVVEVKSFAENAVIYGDGKKSKWYYYLGGKKYDIYSPLKQNAKHIEYLQSFLCNFGNIPYFNVVTMMCKDYKINNINPDPDNITSVVCTSLPAMMRGIYKIADNKPDVLDESTKQKIYDYISQNQYQGKEKRLEHKEKVKSIKREQEEIANQNLCPYCKAPLILRKGKYGDFYGCSNYPKCRYTKKL